MMASSPYWRHGPGTGTEGCFKGKNYSCEKKKSALRGKGTKTKTFDSLFSGGSYPGKGEGGIKRHRGEVDLSARSIVTEKEGS